MRALAAATLIIGALAIGTPGALTSVFRAEASETARNKPPIPPANEVEPAIDRSASYLADAVTPDGSFVYRVNMNPMVKVKDRYNILRHAGSIYAMATHYQYRSKPDPDMRAALERAGRYLRYDAMGPVPGMDRSLAVWSKPEVNHGDGPLQAKLGGAGLGLAALLSLERIEPGFTPLADLQSLGRFILEMQNEDGSFCSKYIPSEGGRQYNWVSLYYPGEAALGLIMLYEYDPSDIWIDAAAAALEYLADSRKGAESVPVDHWALIATERMLLLEDTSGKNSVELPVSRQLLIDHAAQICDTILRSQITDAGRLDLYGSFHSGGRVTPTSTRLEGLLAALGFLPHDHPIRNEIETAVHFGIAFLLRMQVKDAPYSGGFPRSVAGVGPLAMESHDFDSRATEIRIDYVQHALSAMIQYRRIFGH